MGRAFKVYEQFIKTYPIISQSVQSALLMGTGDIIAQTIVEQKSVKNLNIARSAQFATFGLFVGGPALTMWYRFLSKRFGDKGLTVVLKKVSVDQLVFAPSFILVFIGGIGIIQGQTFNDITNKIKRYYTDILISNYRFWPWIQLGNFYFTPLHYQVLVVQSAALLWNTYLSWKTHS